MFMTVRPSRRGPGWFPRATGGSNSPRPNPAGRPPNWSTLEAIVRRRSHPHRRDGLIRAHEVLVATGWFRSIERLHRSGDGRSSSRPAERTLRRGALGEWDHLIDRDGRLLDGRPTPPAGESGFTVLIGVVAPTLRRTDGQPRLRSPWPTSGDHCGQHPATLIRDRSWRSGIEAVDILATGLTDVSGWSPAVRASAGGSRPTSSIPRSVPGRTS